MRSPLKDLETAIVVSPFGVRTRKGRTEFHPGIDIRVVDKALQKPAVSPVCAVEDMRILRRGTGERYGEGFIVAHGRSGYVWKYIHVDYSKMAAGMELLEGDVIGTPNYSGTTSLHLHFEMWDERGNEDRRALGTNPKKLVDPVEKFLKEYDIKWEMA